MVRRKLISIIYDSSTSRQGDASVWKSASCNKGPDLLNERPGLKDKNKPVKTHLKRLWNESGLCALPDVSVSPGRIIMLLAIGHNVLPVNKGIIFHFNQLTKTSVNKKIKKL